MRIPPVGSVHFPLPVVLVASGCLDGLLWRDAVIGLEVTRQVGAAGKAPGVGEGLQESLLYHAHAADFLHASLQALTQDKGCDTALPLE